MDLTAEQQVACDAAIDYVKNGDYARPFSCSGLAGTGKTVTLIEVVKALRSAGANPVVCAPTGKAALVINTKEPALQAKTVHKALSVRPFDSLEEVWRQIDALKAKAPTPAIIKELTGLYKKVDAADRGQLNNLSFLPMTVEEFGETGYDCVVCDEASMIGVRQIFSKLMAHLPVPFLFFGDSGQLPPVEDIPAVDLANPSVRLTKILRQGSDSGIIPFAYEISQRGKYLNPCPYGDVQLVKSGAPGAVEEFLPDHQIVCWTNKVRQQIGTLVRKSRGFIPQGDYPFVPQIGEKVVIDMNDYKRDLLRGEVVKIIGIDIDEKNPYIAKTQIITDVGVEYDIKICMTDLAGDPKHGGFKLPTHDDRMRGDAQDRRSGAIKVQYDGVITAHKAQGSEWAKVLYFGDMWPAHQDWKRHAYTGVTRAREKLVVVSRDLR